MYPDLNWLLILADQHRWDWLGQYGEVPVRTPTLDRLARRGMTFTRAACTSPLCAPSRASLVTGKRPHRTGVPNNHFDLPMQSETYLRLLREAGYRVGAVGKTDLHKKTPWWGLTGWTSFGEQIGFTETVDCAGKWDAVRSGWPAPRDPYMAYLHERGVAKAHVEDFMARRNTPVTPVRNDAPDARGVTVRPTSLDREDYCDNWIGRAANDMLRGFPDRSPWHLMVNLTGPHEPYDAPAELAAGYRHTDFALPDPAERAAGGLTDEEHRAVRRSYAAMIEGIDEIVGELITTIESRGELDRTVIVYSSDHGEMLGEHGLWGKHVMFEPAVRVPLIVAGPPVDRTGALSDALVELPDIAATFLEMAGILVPADGDARSFLDVLRGTTSTHRAAQVAVLDDDRMIFDGRLKLVVDAHAERLYDLVDDPGERRDLSADRPDASRRLRDLLDQELSAPSS